MFPFDIGFGIRYMVKWHKQEKQLEPVWNKWFSEKMDRQIYEHFLGVLNIGTIKQIHRNLKNNCDLIFSLSCI